MPPGAQKYTCVPQSVFHASPGAHKYTCASPGVVCVPWGVIFWEITIICYFLVKKKPSFKAQTLQNETIQEEGKYYELQGKNLSPHSKTLGYVLFLL